MSSRKNPHWGTTLDAFLAEDGMREAAKDALAERMRTSRAQVDRILERRAEDNAVVIDVPAKPATE
ncbi:MAG: hypothetical protein HIU82_12025 [Proteobacteria bacterium]|nr:hypothetical protein [Pseudomonadota bacterium]